MDRKELRTTCEQCQVVSKWKELQNMLSFFLPQPKEREKNVEEKIAEHSLGKSKNFPLPRALRRSLAHQGTSLDVISGVALPASQAQPCPKLTEACGVKTIVIFSFEKYQTDLYFHRFIKLLNRSVLMCNQIDPQQKM